MHAFVCVCYVVCMCVYIGWGGHKSNDCANQTSGGLVCELNLCVESGGP